MFLCVCLLTYIQSRCGEEHMCGLGDICSMEAIVVRYVSMVMVLQGHHIRDKSVSGDTKCLQELALLGRDKGSSNKQVHTSKDKGVRGNLQGFLLFYFFTLYLEDGVHDAAEGSVVGELCYSEYVKTPLVQILQFLVNKHRNIKCEFRNKVIIKEMVVKVQNVQINFEELYRNYNPGCPNVFICGPQLSR